MLGMLEQVGVEGRWRFWSGYDVEYPFSLWHLFAIFWHLMMMRVFNEASTVIGPNLSKISLTTRYALNMVD